MNIYSNTLIASALGLTLASLSMATAQSAAINVQAYSAIGMNVIDFEDVAASPFPGTVYNSIFSSGGASFGERFAGQTLSFAGDNDVLSGSPTGPLSLQTGAVSQNLAVGTDNGTHNLIPCGALGCASGNGYGEGSFAILFAAPVAVFGMKQFFADSSVASTTLDFFNTSGGLIARVIVSAGGSMNFARAGGIQDIAGVSIFTDDPGGLGYDDLVYGPILSLGVPEPTTWALMLTGFGLAGVALRRAHRPSRLEA